MSKSIPGNNKHLTLSDRIYIEECLNKDMSFKEIAKYLCKDPTTISREVRNHLTITPSFNRTSDPSSTKKGDTLVPFY